MTLFPTLIYFVIIIVLLFSDIDTTVDAIKNQMSEPGNQTMQYCTVLALKYVFCILHVLYV